MATDIISVAAHARLHLGFLDMNGGLGRQFGGIGLSISSPATRISLRQIYGQTIVEGPERTRARWHLEALRSHLGIEHTHHHLTIASVIPAHSGLGSGTQIALAVAAALRSLHGMPLDPEGDMEYLGRGGRSGIGVGFFLNGGLIVDGGKGKGSAPPPVIARLPFPDQWRVILVLDNADRGFHGKAEADAFEGLALFPERDAADICRLVLMQALPAVAEHDIAAFGAAIADIQRRVGEHFAPVQGGVFASPRVAAAMAALAGLGAYGIGQSSWGPTGFAFAESDAQAQEWLDKLTASGQSEGLDVRIVEGRNEGAEIERIDTAASGA